jgi:hypothetical protein
MFCKEKLGQELDFAKHSRKIKLICEEIEVLLKNHYKSHQNQEISMLVI